MRSLAYLSRRLNGAFLIKIRPLSVVVVVVVINFSHFHLLECWNEGPNFFQGMIITKWRKYIDIFFKSSCPCIFVWSKLKFIQWRVLLLSPRGDNYGKAKIHWWNLKIFFSRTTGPISTKLDTIILGWRGFKFVQIKTPPFSKRRYFRYSYNTLTKFFSRITGPMSTKLCTVIPLSEGNSTWVC